jgi:phytoene dehydrogenase-like protein
VPERSVVVVGAGLAGLCCALDLTRRGVPVSLLEASDAPGGALRTDSVQGFLLDRGFQAFQTAYPEARCRLDYAALRLHAFRPGALVRWRGRLRRLGDPFRAPREAWATLRSGIPTLGDAVRVARLRRELARASLEEILTRPGRAGVDALRRRGFSERMIRGFFQPLFRGVFLEPELATSSRLLEFAFRMFATGPVCLPAAGMGAIPAQLAARLPPGVLRLRARVASVDDDGATLESGERVAARAVVVAASHPEARRLLPELPPIASNAVTTLSFDAPTPPVAEPILVLNGDESGPVSHLCVPSQVAPEYGPKRHALVSVSVLGVPQADDEHLAARVRDQLRGWFGSEVESWRLLRADRLPDALPRQTPERFDPATRPARVSGARFVCGAHREAASIGGAMRSGRRAARAVLAAP